MARRANHKVVWRMAEKCADCPFASSGKGLRLRRTLRRTRWMSILDALRDGNFFPCHKTTRETGDGSNLVCAGAIEWQNTHGCSSAYVRLCEWRDKTNGSRLSKIPRGRES